MILDRVTAVVPVRADFPFVTQCSVVHIGDTHRECVCVCVCVCCPWHAVEAEKEKTALLFFEGWGA